MIQKTTIGIDGMHCASCSAAAEKALKALPGVRVANVNLPLEEAALEYDDKRVGMEQFSRAISAVGFKVRQDDISQDDRQITAMRAAWNRMWTVWTITAVVLVFMVPHMFMGRMLISHHVDSWTLFILSLAAMLIPARGVYVSAFKSIRGGSANMDVLIAIGTIAALLVFPLSRFVQGINPHAFGGISAMILAFHLTGRYLESRARGKASEAIRKLVGLGAKTAILMVDGEETEVPLRKVAVDDVFVVKPGMKVPTDGVIISGNAHLDEALVTGESMPVSRKEGDTILGATLNIDGRLTARATRVGEDTFLAQVVRLVQEAQHSKVPIQLLADRVTAIFVPAVLVLTLITFAVWMLFPDTMAAISGALRSILPLNQGSTGLAAALMASIATLVIACPCALGLATPTALMVGSGIGARKGVLVRNGEALQTMKDVRAMVFDKTGTLTFGQPEVTSLQVLDGDPMQALGIAAALESGSGHPIAKAIIRHASSQGVGSISVEGFQDHAGKGISGTIQGQRYYLGSPGFLTEMGISLPSTLDASSGQAWLADQSQVLAVFHIADTVRPEAAEVVASLRAMGIEPVMLSGDNAATAGAIASQCGITRYYAKALPADKAGIIKALQQEYGKVAMAGDGINDAPALKQADIGIAMGKGTDIAIEASDITIVRDDLRALPLAVKLSTQTFRKIRQNLFWAFFYNLIAIPLAVTGVLHPVIAEIAMAGSSITVVTNANMLRRAMR